jgi:hypothetical protein
VALSFSSPDESDRATIIQCRPWSLAHFATANGQFFCAYASVLYCERGMLCAADIGAIASARPITKTVVSIAAKGWRQRTTFLSVAGLLCIPGSAGRGSSRLSVLLPSKDP